MSELKKAMLKLLEEDEEFRLAIAAKIGLKEILDELRKLREDFNKLYRKSIEYDKRFESIEKKLIEHDKRFEAIEKKLLEHDKRFEVIEKKLLEHDKKFESILHEIKKIWETLVEQNKRISHIEDTLGALAESFYARFALDTIIQECTYRGDRVVQWVRNARVDEEDIDLLVVTEKSVYVVEVKIKPRHSDVGKLLAKTDIVKKKYPDREAIAILSGTRIGKEVIEYAISKGIRIYSW